MSELGSARFRHLSHVNAILLRYVPQVTFRYTKQISFFIYSTAVNERGEVREHNSKGKHGGNWQDIQKHKADMTGGEKSEITAVKESTGHS
jgi:hypothetical protein